MLNRIEISLSILEKKSVQEIWLLKTVGEKLLMKHGLKIN